MATAHISADEKSDSSTLTRDKLYVNPTHLEARYPGTPRVSLTCYPGSPRVSASFHGNHSSIPSLDALSLNKNRRRSTIHSYNLVNYYALPQDSSTNRNIRQMTERKALKNVIVLGLSFMFVHTAFVSILSLQSIMNPEGGIGVVSISCIYATTVISCLLAPLLINTISAKWTMIVAFFLFTGYFAGNFYPKQFMLIPLGLILGMLGGPLMAAQMTYVTTVALTYAHHALIIDQETVVNKYMGIFCAFYRSSYIWGNLITTLVLSNNQTLRFDNLDNFGPSGNLTETIPKHENVTEYRTCGASSCQVNSMTWPVEKYDITNNPFTFETEIPDSTKYMLLSIYLGCGIMAAVILMALLDMNVGSKKINADLKITTKELFFSTINMLKDSRCQLLVPLVLFVGLEQGFIFGDFTQSFVNCTMGVYSLGPILMCFGGVSALASIVISCIAKHIKRFAFITAGATFNVGLLIVLWLWKPVTEDVPNFFVVAACLGLCDAIWQTQTYTLFGILFVDKQEAAFASYRMFYATGCAISFGYSFFLCVQTKVYILAGMLTLSLLMYSVIEMKVQLQSQHIKDIVAF
ncbi:protein unc-93 homolog A-like [Mercenaria mercenaria]|uniref:protein unc-93 homolog A-like n=1 Tax=Mercenaria mercenaria TaxID=6596 RepID=UPI00234EC6D7|nr:protein unc-93 homolog A-like [Mercenaria mercenaria]XP_045173843.2 protein unc-93 homolog A-like [Mercenaria mercenaria]XP_045173844.2 protein unc-93 homolog A-like [Mercenaria mercenaria]XP_045173845.2 protein unc-93 homolog A-like [Mercenaria mercenaria]XP_045173846.2 protein unc-93 homolog A-like [Mercenaria mercenaria]XP_053375562.1 protein unc-93 homolog A-like [Mercenaria mercenaria]